MSTNPYQIWIERGSIKLLLPVNPEKINIRQNGNNQSVTLAELGEATILQAPKAITLSFSSFLPSTYVQGGHYATAQNSADSAMTVTSGAMQVLPHFCINFIMGAMTAKQPVRVTITKCSFSRIMTIESFSYSQKGGDVGSYDYSLSFKEYQEIAVRQIRVKNNTAQLPKKTEKRVSIVQKPKTYKVKKGDCLWNIAKKYYGDGSKYTKIYEANKKLIGSNPNLIKVGMLLTLP